MELADKLELERRLQETKKVASQKDEEIQALEESVEGARTLWKRFFATGQPTTTLYNLFVYEYTHIKLSASPKEVWQDRHNAYLCREF